MESRDMVEKAVDAIEAEIEVPAHLDKREMAWRTWFQREIHKSGGISILPHSYGIIGGTYNVQTKVVEAVLERGLCDVYEAVSGTENLAARRLQSTFWQEARAKGYDLPIVGSSDTHSAAARDFKTFDYSWTIVFAQNPDTVPEDILSKYSVAVDNIDQENKCVYGSLRLVKYAWFLIENYYKYHDALCSDIGSAVLRYVFGDRGQSALIALLEAELDKYNQSFFG